MGGPPTGDPLQLVRWIFLVFCLASALLLMVVLSAQALSGHHVIVAIAVVTLPCLGAKWFDEYRGQRRHPLSWDLVEAMALLVVGVAAGSPLTILLLLYCRLAFHGLVERTGRLIALSAASTAAYLGALLLLRAIEGPAAQPAASLWLASGFAVVASSFHVLGTTLVRLGRALERELALRLAMDRLSPALADDEMPQAAVAAVLAMIGRTHFEVALALGPTADMRIAAVSRVPPPPGVIGRKLSFSLLSAEQSGRLRHGGLQLAGAELAAVWPVADGPPPHALFLATLAVDAVPIGTMLVSGTEEVPAEDRVTLITLLEHIALSLQAATMSGELQRRRSDERLESLTRHTSDVITVIDRDGTLRYVSPASATVLGVRPQDLVGQRLPYLVHPDDVRDVERALNDATATEGAMSTMEFRVVGVAGEWRYLEALGTNLLHDPDVAGVIVTMRDITDRRRMEMGLRESETNFRRLFEVNPQPMWLYDATTFEFLAVNEAAVLQYGYTREEFLSMQVDELSATALDPHSSPKRNRRRHEAREETQHRSKEGLVIDVQVESSLLVFRSRDAVLMLVRDVTDERELHRRLEHQTLHDALTGLPNRRLLDTHIRRALARAERLFGHQPALLVLDLDGFKTINDTLGHALGDRVIVAVGERLLTSLRPGDTASRLGGDEFAVLLEDTGGPDEAMLVAQRLVAEIERPLSIDGRSLAVSASIGVALPQKDHAGVDGIVGDADIAMYVAKGLGNGSCVLFEPGHRAALIDRLTMQEELGVALASGQLLVHYQPQLELDTGRVVAVEALVRWQHPTRGMILPDVFIPVGEQMGLIPAIDAWVLRSACQQLRRWCDDGLPPMRIAVNLSSSDLERADLVDVVRGVLLDCMLDPWQLELELTESVAIGQPESAVARLAALRALGVRIAIDDFGTGYSMFSRLRDLPVDRLKIDRSFVADITTDDDARAIVGSTIAMGHALGLDLVAEGVEDEATAAVLREMHCDTAQGYHFARPLPADELSEWLRAWLGAQVA
jgi:diguanylate cyclase (GGDEF)-like protein/PAS domain S-box-containing protein